MTDTKVVALADGVDFNQPILDMNNQPIIAQDADENQQEVRLGTLCVNALMAGGDGDTADGTEKLARFNLAQKIQGNAQEFPTIRLNSTQKKTILDQAEKLYMTLMYARIYEALEGTTETEE